MQVSELGDPRLQTLFGTRALSDRDLAPAVALPRPGIPVWVLAGGAAIAAVALFWMLESRRNSQPQPSTRVRAADASQFAAEPPPLYIPPAPARSAGALAAFAHPQGPALEVPVKAPQRSRPTAVTHQLSASRYAGHASPEMPPPPMPAAPQANDSPVLVIDSTVATAATAKLEAGPAQDAAQAFPESPIRHKPASATINRSDTVSQGSLIPAVLETAFDSTRPGFARAIVSRDVRGSDGSRILIPRGSRLIGEYSSDLLPGQKRALIRWTRLIRPDGLTTAIDATAVDRQGRAGVRASSSSNALERVAGAVLQTGLEFGRALVGRGSSSSVVITMAGSGQGTVAAAPQRRPPTLRVPAGTSISIFVAYDLEFSSRPAA